MVLSATVNATDDGDYTTFVEISSGAGSTSLPISWTSQSPACCIKEQALVFRDSFVGRKSHSSVTLVNLSSLACHFSIPQQPLALGDLPVNYALTTEPIDGMLPPRGSASIKSTLLSHVVGPLPSAALLVNVEYGQELIAAPIEARVDGVHLVLTATRKEARVTTAAHSFPRTPRQSLRTYSEALELDFGVLAPREDASFRLHARNLSRVRANLCIGAVGLSCASSEKAHGISFGTSATRLDLQADGDGYVDVKCLAVLPGLYQDTLLITCDNMEPMRVPLRVHVEGPLLKVSGGAGGIVRFPPLILPPSSRNDNELTAVVQRQIKLHNPTATTLQVQLVTMAVRQDDVQLVDVLPYQLSPSGAIKLRARLHNGLECKDPFMCDVKQVTVGPMSNLAVGVSFSTTSEGRHRGLLQAMATFKQTASPTFAFVPEGKSDAWCTEAEQCLSLTQVERDDLRLERNATQVSLQGQCSDWELVHDLEGNTLEARVDVIELLEGVKFAERCFRLTNQSSAAVPFDVLDGTIFTSHLTGSPRGICNLGSRKQQEVAVRWALPSMQRLVSLVKAATNGTDPCLILDQDGSLIQHDQLTVHGVHDGHSKTVRLLAIIHLPALEISTESLDFADSLIGSQHVREMSIINRGRVACEWHAHFVSAGNRDTDVFGLAQMGGTLEAFVDQSGKNRATLSVTFSPSSHRRYSTTIVFKDALGLRLHLVKLTGSVLLDERVEDDVAVD